MANVTEPVNHWEEWTIDNNDLSPYAPHGYDYTANRVVRLSSEQSGFEARVEK